MAILQQKKNDILRALRCGFTQEQVAELVGVCKNTIIKLLKTRKRIIVLSDKHCGHIAGLTPPAYQNYHRGLAKYQEQQDEAWQWYAGVCKRLKADITFILGDMMDGKGKRSGSSEYITTEWKEQMDMACMCIEETGAKRAVMVYGTPFHVGENDDFEDFIKGKLSTKMYTSIQGHAFPKVHQIQFDLKHKIGASGIPHGRSTSMMKSKLWNTMWAERNQQPDSDVLIRGHVHYFNAVQNPMFLGITCPALQSWGSKYGIRQCEGIVDFGLIWFDVYDGDTLDTLQWHYEVPHLSKLKVNPTILA